ncbi:hypothetical protein HUT18_28785 [Streptomyces sp. NA04227]|uniref:hypothetical protein n=1 Tax=Streptomyces sp. NA04227 TaxID=2742136 RepID=UPI0015905842|nr:hypothetical protein [Streptomyces sp. NA04227]QKW09813.1 hypothetical protein HUT18_28785 [Streptomyces sp. NA04227]
MEIAIATRAPSPPNTRPAALPVPGLTEGTELVGEFTGSGYRVPPHLVHRFDGQVIHLPPLLYQVTKLIGREERRHLRTGSGDGRTAMAQVAAQLGRATGREFTADHIVFLMDKKLAPLGITRYSDGSPPEIPKANSFLTLRFRKAVLSERATWFIAGLFAWLFTPLVLMAVVATVLVGEVWVFLSQDVGTAVATSMASPNSVLIVVTLTLTSSAFHECGHAAACRYGKVKPGVMGCGIYLVWPAFYTDVTNSYRLGRAGRLRTDLGGVYFNGIFVLALIAAYLNTHNPVILAAILFTNLEMAQQLLPTLRFDGYYIVSDLVGIPDLFKYIGPILKHAVLRKPADARLDALKRWPQIVVTVWVLTVLPALAVQLAIVLTRLPQWTASALDSTHNLADEALNNPHPVLGVASALLQIILLLLPLVGVLLICWQLLSSLLGFLIRRYVPEKTRAAFAARLTRRRRRAAFLTLALAAALALIAWALIPSPQPTTAHRPTRTTTPTPAPSPTHPHDTKPAPQDGKAAPATASPSPEAAEEAATDDDGAHREKGRSGPQSRTEPSEPSDDRPADSAPPRDENTDTESDRPANPDQGKGERKGEHKDADKGDGTGDGKSGEKPCTTVLDLPLGPLLCR